jgi:hypothetical protein
VRRRSRHAPRERADPWLLLFGLVRQLATAIGYTVTDPPTIQSQRMGGERMGGEPTRSWSFEVSRVLGTLWARSANPRARSCTTRPATAICTTSGKSVPSIIPSRCDESLEIFIRSSPCAGRLAPRRMSCLLLAPPRRYLESSSGPESLSLSNISTSPWSAHAALMAKVTGGPVRARTTRENLDAF